MPTSRSSASPATPPTAPQVIAAVFSDVDPAALPGAGEGPAQRDCSPELPSDWSAVSLPPATFAAFLPDGAAEVWRPVQGELEPERPASPAEEHGGTGRVGGGVALHHLQDEWHLLTRQDSDPADGAASESMLSRGAPGPASDMGDLARGASPPNSPRHRPGPGVSPREAGGEQGKGRAAAELLEGMLGRPHDPDAQREGVGGLARLLGQRGDPAAGWPAGLRRDVARAVSAGGACLLSTGAEPEAQLQVLAVLRALSGRFRGAEGQGQYVAGCGGVGAALRAMRAFPGDLTVQGAACALLRRLCHAAPAACDSAAAGGGAPLCAAALALALDSRGDGAEPLVRESLAVLALVSRRADPVGLQRDQSEMMGPADQHAALRSVLTAMGRSGADHGIQRAGCAALAALCALSRDAGGEDGMQPAQLGAATPVARAVLSAMEKFPSDAETNLEACRALTSLAPWGQAAKRALQDRGVVPGVLAAMHKFTHDAALQQEACSALAHLCYDYEPLTIEIAAKGGVGAVVSAMGRLSPSLRVQLAACDALAKLAFNSPQGQGDILTLGGVKAIASAMRVHADRVKMQEVGTLVVGTLAWHEGIKQELAEQGVIEVVLDAMRRYPDHRVLQRNACRAVSQLAFNSDPNRDRICDQGGVKIVVAAARAHPECDKAVLNAVVALTYLTYRSEPVVRQLVEAGGAELADDVIADYPDHERLRKKAEHLRIIVARRPRGPPRRDDRAGAGERRGGGAAGANWREGGAPAVPAGGRRGGRASRDWRAAEQQPPAPSRAQQLSKEEWWGPQNTSAAHDQRTREGWSRSRFGDGAGLAALRSEDPPRPGTKRATGKKS
eukprot:TRINITY_DN32323_c0_g1_i1.p2 TRINITY_DN32323_c0_g1~~TRINITY_DN32323_c0_g1_i1.p2  ORF type:complete len:875 (+),score=238.29 TRINITY_DN32323_c0_g1_i1:97-2625(+)